MTLIMDKCEEGLKELASMIAADFRRRTADESILPLNDSGCDGSHQVSETEIVICMEPSDSRAEMVYTETVSVRNFIRNKKQ